MASSEETSIQNFKFFLHSDADYELVKIETFFQALKQGDASRLEDAKFAANEKLNKIYFEFLDFITFLEQEAKHVNLAVLKDLIKRVEKNAKAVDSLRKHILGISERSFKEKYIFEEVKRNIPEWIEELRAQLQELQEELSLADKVMKSAGVNAERAERYLLGEMEVKLKELYQNIKLPREQFESQRKRSLHLVKQMEEQLQQHYGQLRAYRKMLLLKKILAELELALENVKKLGKKMAKPIPSHWEQMQFAAFQKDCRTQLQSAREIAGIAAISLRTSQKELVA